MNTEHTVGPIGRVTSEVPEGCPLCGGRLQPAFGQRTEDNGKRYVVIDYSAAFCRDCGEMFPTRER